MDKNIIKKILPKQDIINFWLEHSLTDSPWLLMHIFLSRILIITLSEKIPKNVDFDLDTAMNLATVYHSSRQEADYWKMWISKNQETNKFMQDNWDMDYALEEVKKSNFDSKIVNWIQNYIITPKNRVKYFPHDSLEKDWEMNITESIAMLASWLIAWVITNTDKRFDDLIERRNWEIWKLELDYIKNEIKYSNENEDLISQSIFEIASKDNRFNIKTKKDIIKLIKESKINNEIIWEWILNWYKDYANKIIQKYCEITWVKDFYWNLKDSIDIIDDKNYKEKIKKTYEKFLWRELKQDEMIPYIPWVELAFKRLALLKTKETKDIYKKRIEKILEESEKVIRHLSN